MHTRTEQGETVRGSSVQTRRVGLRGYQYGRNSLEARKYVACEGARGQGGRTYISCADPQLGNALARKLKEVAPDASAPGPDAKRQELIDSSIQEKIHAELSKLRKQEQDMQKKIELALEKENIERQGKPWFGKDKGQSSELLQQELNRVKAQIEKFNKRSIDSIPALKKAREDIIQCYRCVCPILTSATTRSGRSTAGVRSTPLTRPSLMRRRSSLPRGSNTASRTFVLQIA